MNKETVMRFVWPAAMAVVVAGCTSTAERQARDAQFVGKPEAEFARAFGAPIHQPS